MMTVLRVELVVDCPMHRMDDFCAHPNNEGNKCQTLAKWTTKGIVRRPSSCCPLHKHPVKIIIE
jgi:hypothetical protein